MRKRLLGDVPSEGLSGPAKKLGEPPDSNPTASPARHPRHQSWRAEVLHRQCHLL